VVTFNPAALAPAKRVLRRRGHDSSKKLDFDHSKTSDVKEEEKDKVFEHVQRKRRSSDRQDDGLRRRALRSYRKSSEDSNNSEESKPETIMSEPAKGGSHHKKAECEDSSPPLLIPCSLLGSTRGQGEGEGARAGDKGAPGSLESGGDGGQEILATILQWQLLTPEALTQLPSPPTLLYGPTHLLRLFGTYSFFTIITYSQNA